MRNKREGLDDMNPGGSHSAVVSGEHLPVIDTTLLTSIASQLLYRPNVVVQGQVLPVHRTSRLSLRTLEH